VNIRQKIIIKDDKEDKTFLKILSSLSFCDFVGQAIGFLNTKLLFSAYNRDMAL
jgi:hypothetical protein